MKTKLSTLPLSIDVETTRILKALPAAHAALAELKGVATTLPNISILLNTLALQEAKDSSAIENIITTNDDLFRAELNLSNYKNVAAKEVQNYSTALLKGYELIKENGLITVPIILEIHKELEQNDAGFRLLPGTELINERTREVVYTPPQDGNEVKELMSNLAEYINIDDIDGLDPLVKMAIIHHQFESIHPFYDGNGRTGRILNILFLVAKGLLDSPILYHSRYIIQNKDMYYELLQKARAENKWEEWILYMIEGIELIARQSIGLIKGIKDLMQVQKIHIRDNYKFYSQDLLNNLFRHPYTKIEFLQDEIGVSRQTASKYLNLLHEDKTGILEKVSVGKEYYYINVKLMELITKYDYKVK